MLEEVKYCKTVIKKHFNKPLVMTEVDEQNFETMDRCHICGEKYTDKDVLVRDHCQITGKFRGSAHQECNLKLRIRPKDIKIPVIFHNLRRYDSHFSLLEGSIYHIVILTTLSLLIIKDLRSSFLIFTPKNSQFLKPQNLLQLLLISICFSREIEATI